ncbi:MAG: HyaD/HybD family hydrogenase maturation endopeptidase [Propionibacteriaceae bacterium]|nr:HyaD/HybD family hydrogenase maturation endopeptidase [Propionibacteriaceae bacterium]
MGSPITVLGVGNPIMGDDGAGLELLASIEKACAEEMYDRDGAPVPRTPDDIAFIDGGTGGMELLPEVQDAQRLLVLDAVAGKTPGEVKVLSGDQIPRLLATKLSPHQVGLLDIFAAARMLGREPGVVLVVGIVPELVDLQLGLTPAVSQALPEATAKAVEVITDWLVDSTKDDRIGMA